MKIEDQICSLELAKQLKELGFEQKSLFRWDERDGVEDRLEYMPEFLNKTHELVSAYTVAELGEMLPTEIEFESKLTGKKEKQRMAFLTNDIVEQKNNFYGVDKYRLFIIEIGKYQVKERTEADARAKMLIYLKTNNLL